MIKICQTILFLDRFFPISCIFEFPLPTGFPAQLDQKSGHSFFWYLSTLQGSSNYKNVSDMLRNFHVDVDFFYSFHLKNLYCCRFVVKYFCFNMIQNLMSRIFAQDLCFKGFFTMSDFRLSLSLVNDHKGTNFQSHILISLNLSFASFNILSL